MLDIFSLQKGAILKLVYGCNHHCSFCHEKDNIFSYKYGLIQMEDLENIRVWLKKHNFDYVILSGGECSLHPDLRKIIDYFQKEFYVVLISNGSHIEKHDFSYLSKNITFYFSFHGLHEVYNKVTSSEDFEILIRNIHTIENLGHPIILRCVLNKLNIDSLPEISTYVYKNFGENVFLEIVLLEDLKYSHVANVHIPIKDYLGFLLTQIGKEKRFLFDGGPLCLSPLLEKYGKYFADPLTNTMVGLVKKEKNGTLVYDIKQSVSQKNIKSQLKKCSSCKVYKYCHGCDSSYLSQSVLDLL